MPPPSPVDIDYSLIDHVKEDLCPGAHDVCGVSPGVVDAGTDTFDAHLLPDSLARDAGTAEGVPAEDYAGNLRDAQPDIGAYEYGAAPPQQLFLALLVRP